jgi:lipoyl(octanoyl) transferase
MLVIEMDQILFKSSKQNVEYPFAIDFMESRVEEIIHGKNKQLLWFLQHPPIYTAGTGAVASDLLSKELNLYQTGRGGKITFHGPGQRVVYVMLDLNKIFAPLKPDLRAFIRMLEEWVIASLADLGLKCFTKEGMIGIWTNKDGMDLKISAIGIRVRRWVSFHGVAINVCPDMEYFKGIIPCGIRDFGVTSLDEMGIKASMEEVDNILKMNFRKIFYEKDSI